MNEILTIPASDHPPDEHGDIAIACQGDADPKTVARVLAQPVSDDGRGPWFWLRLNNGDLFLACAPRGATYERLEGEPGTGWGI